MTLDEAREALATLNNIGVDGTGASWAVTHRDEISAAFDKLLTFVSEVERLQAENTTLREFGARLFGALERATNDSPTPEDVHEARMALADTGALLGHG